MKFWVKFDLKFEISDGKYAEKFGRPLFTCQESTRDIGANFGRVTNLEKRA